ncbi:flavodoxin family protein [Acetivibrio mesophilus]|jgi:flavodoxin|uniref:Flavodoxin n=1 Tax=Acetivibrio mesophilus TaxID=2487273 RepID=A0A4Q0I077_9FIRM|nr:flavodoxin family protein [Acetivibrio mesophilus]RXE57596.1 flavodoxin [Acetivibrio mesophilus]
MKTAIVYYSRHHGNTKKLLDAIATVDNVTLIDVTKHSAYSLSEFDLIGFASGIYYQKFSKKVLDFAKSNLPFNKKVFFIYTCGIKFHFYTKAIRAVVSGKNADIVGEYGCPGFDTFGPFKIVGGIRKGRPNEKDIARAVQFFRRISK